MDKLFTIIYLNSFVTKTILIVPKAMHHCTFTNISDEIIAPVMEDYDGVMDPEGRYFLCVFIPTSNLITKGKDPCTSIFALLYILIITYLLPIVNNIRH